MQLPTVDGMQDMKYDIECDVDCAIRHAIMLINNSEGVDQTTAQRILPSIILVDYFQQLRHLGWFDFAPEKLIVDITSPVRNLNLLAVPKQWSECPKCDNHVSLVPNSHYEQYWGYASRLATETNLIVTNSMPAQKPSTNVIDGEPAFRE